MGYSSWGCKKSNTTEQLTHTHTHTHTHTQMCMRAHTHTHTLKRVSQVAPVVKNSPTNAGDVKDLGSIPGLGGSPEGGMATHSSILAWRIPRKEEPGKLQPVGSQRGGHD